MNNPVERKLEIITKYLRHEITIQKACKRLLCTPKTFFTYRKLFVTFGTEGLKDHRGGNNKKLKNENIKAIIELKQHDVWRSGRNIRDNLRLPVHPITVRRHMNTAGLGKINITRIKPIATFEATEPNEMWQTDIMGKMNFPRIGPLYLISTLDDHSRFVPAAEWFGSQHKAHVFIVWYYSLLQSGIPHKILQDRGSQYKARSTIGQADYEYYASKLGISLIFAKRAQTKGKIERFWRFVQSDFVPGVLPAESKKEVNEKFQAWLHWYNYEYKSEYFGNVTHASRWKASERKPSKEELDDMLTVWERRRVTVFNTISLYGMWYRVPPGYMKCRIWIRIVGNTLYFQSMDKIFHTCRLRFR
jgi:transposase InsO family protein